MVVTARAPATLCAEVVAAAPRHGGHPPGRMLMACVTLAFLVIFAPLAARQANAAFLVQIDVEAPLISGTQPASIFTFSAIAFFDPFNDNDSSSEFRTFDQIAMTVDEQPYLINEPIRFQYFNADTVLGEGDKGLLRTGGLDTDLSRIDTLPRPNDFFFQLGGFYNSGQQQLLQPALVAGGLVRLDVDGGLRSIGLEDATVSASNRPAPRRFTPVRHRARRVWLAGPSTPARGRALNSNT